MAAILLTSNNVNFVKSALRASMPQVKSAHLTEALAFGFGFGTHAALRAMLKADMTGFPMLVMFDETHLAARLAALGYVPKGSEPLDGIIRSPSLPDRIWVEFRSGERAANDRWFRECRQRGIPNLRIERRRKYVELHWDCVSLDPSDEAHLQGNPGAALVRQMFGTYQGIARRIPGKSEFSGSSFVGSVGRLLPELAYEMADAFFGLLYEPMRSRSLAA